MARRKFLPKFSPDEARDPSGRWTSGGGGDTLVHSLGPGDSQIISRPSGERAASEEGNLQNPRGDYTVRTSSRFRYGSAKPDTAYELTHSTFAIPTVRVEPNVVHGAGKIEMSGTGSGGITPDQADQLIAMLNHAKDIVASMPASPAAS